MTLTAATLTKIFPKLKPVRAAQLATVLNEVCPAYNINTPARMAAFLAQVAVESACFECKTENLNYSAQGLRTTFPKYFSVADAAAYARKPTQIGNRAYANRNGNGNEASGDGFRYRGGGFLQLTGKDMYKSYAAHRKGELQTVTDAVRNEDRAALDSACWVFAVNKGLLDECDRGEIVTISRRINGGDNGLEERKKYYSAVKAALGMV